MYIRNQTSQAFVTSSGPLGDNSCLLENRPKNAKSINSCHIEAFQDDLIGNFWQFSNRFQFLFFDGRPNMEWILRAIAQFFFLQVRNIFPPISSRDPPCHQTKRLFCVGFIPTKKGAWSSDDVIKQSAKHDMHTWRWLFQVSTKKDAAQSPWANTRESVYTLRR